MLVRWVGFLLGAIAVSVTSYVVIWPRVLHATSSPHMSPAAKNYLDQAIKLFREQHINAAKVDWQTLTKEAYWAADGAKTTADTYPAIWFIIRSLGEKHTLLVDPDHARADATGKPSGEAKPQPFLPPRGERLTNGIGVIRLFGFFGPVDEGKLYAQQARAQISDMKAHGVCRFVLDLREDDGGNMYPMLNGVSGLLEPGVLGTFQFPDGEYAAWALADGTVTEQPPRRSLPVARRTSPTLPVAVLIGRDTGSAGEFTAMSFEGRANTRFFGSPTAGFVTANTPIQLSDGAVLVMTVAWGLDRTGRRYVDRIEPDEATGSGDAALCAAVTWLSHQSC
jgi:carboxyl-terminal processing protease